MRIFRPSNARPGFTLLEILVVVTIIGILAAVTAPAITNTMEVRALDGAARDIFMALQSAKWKAASDKCNYRVRFVQVGTVWNYIIEREATAGTWTTAPGAFLKSIPKKFGVTVSLPVTSDVIFTPTGFIYNGDSTKNTIVITSAKLAAMSQPGTRTIKFYIGGSIQFAKS